MQIAKRAAIHGKKRAKERKNELTIAAKLPLLLLFLSYRIASSKVCSFMSTWELFFIILEFASFFFFFVTLMRRL